MQQTVSKEKTPRTLRSIIVTSGEECSSMQTTCSQFMRRFSSCRKSLRSSIMDAFQSRKVSVLSHYNCLLGCATDYCVTVCNQKSFSSDCSNSRRRLDGALRTTKK